MPSGIACSHRRVSALTQRISIIAARAANDTIGHNGRMPWHLPADLRRFRRITMGKPLIMGRRTCESLGLPLPGRRNLVVSRTPGFHAPGFECLPGLEQALAVAGEVKDILIIGGADLYRQCLPLATRIYLTEIHSTFPGDTIFPSIDKHEWTEIERLTHSVDDKHPWSFSFTRLERRRIPSCYNIV